MSIYATAATDFSPAINLEQQQLKQKLNDANAQMSNLYRQTKQLCKAIATKVLPALTH